MWTKLAKKTGFELSIYLYITSNKILKSIANADREIICTWQINKIDKFHYFFEMATAVTPSSAINGIDMHAMVK